ncbi:MAG: hypothetical protein ABJ308_03055 [Halieaceae bacterium]
MNTRKARRSLTSSVLLFALLATVSVLSVDTADSRPGARGGARGGAMRSGPASGGSVRGGHRDNRMDRGSNRSDNRRETRDTRNDNRKESRDNRHEGRKDVRDERREWHEDRWRRHRTRHITRAAFRSLSCTTTTVIANGVTYYSCGRTYYERVYQGGSVVYVVVSAPSGY